MVMIKMNCDSGMKDTYRDAEGVEGICDTDQVNDQSQDEMKQERTS